jgi:hypothetical protein
MLLGAFLIVDGLLLVRFRYEISEALADRATRSWLIRLILVPHRYKPKYLIILGLGQILIGIVMLLDAGIDL